MENIREKFKEKIKEYEEKSKKDNNYYLFTSEAAKKMAYNPNVSDDSLSFFYDFYEEWDEYGSLPLSLGLFYEKAIKDDSIYLGIHRSDSIRDMNDEILENIFNNGLINNGDLSSGAVHNSAVNPNKTLSPLNDIRTAVILSKTGRKHGDRVSVIAAIPSKYVNKDLNIINDSEEKIYNEINNIKYIKSEYMVGAIYHENGNCIFNSKEEILNNKKNKTY